MMRRRLISGKAPEMEQNVDESLLNKSWDQTDNAIINVNKYQLKSQQQQHLLKWYWSPIILLLLLFYYFGIALQCANYLPTPLLIKEQHLHPDQFIAEKAADFLRGLTELGPRVVGSTVNEVDAVRYLTNCINDIKKEADLSVNDFEIDFQVASGSYAIKRMINMYQAVQNIVVKLSPKSRTNSTSYLLINSHYDSVPGSPGGSDDGAMVVVMLEILRVLSKSPTQLQNPIVFLFNGAEENPLQASHAFITQHKWAKYVKAVINLDSAGSGGREILFQSGPQHSWLMKYFHAAIRYPYASTVAEELFQSNLIPSDTDFRIFRDYGKVPGLDLAYQQNGYVYHTKFDRSEIIPLGTLQRTGDNILNLAIALANAPELSIASILPSGHTIFFDYLGLFLIFYTETEGLILNGLVGFTTLLACLYSLHVMSKNTGMRIVQLFKHCLLAGNAQIAAILLSFGVCMLLAILLDVLEAQMSWFTHTTMIIGLYICPLYAGLSLLTAFYVNFNQKDRLTRSYKVQLLMHSQCMVFAVLMVVLSVYKIRSAFLFTIIVLCYLTGLIFNLATKLHNKPLAWMIPHFICISPAFIFYAYICHGFFVTFIPMTGRFGNTVNPEFIIGGFAAGTGLLTGSLMMPLIHLIKHSRKAFAFLLMIATICLVIANTPVGFPFRPETNIKRLIIVHSRRTLRNFNNEVKSVQTGYVLLPMDRRPLAETGLDLTRKVDLTKDCTLELGCALPVYTYRWYEALKTSVWLQGPDPDKTVAPTLKLLSKNDLNPTHTRYTMKLEGPDHMSIFIRTLNNETVLDWSFHPEPLKKNWEQPYFIYFSYGLHSDALQFWLDIKRTSKSLDKPTLEIGISGHWNHNDELLTREFKYHLNHLPNYVFANAWTATYDNWFF